MRNTLILSACVLALVACDNGGSGTPDSGSSSTPDSGSSTTPDSGSSTTPDSGSSTDSCQASNSNAMSTVGCNGGVLGPSQAANDFGGLCTAGADPMTDPAGTCTNTNGICAGDAGQQGLCLTTCTPGADYVSTGGCPTGSRCFDLGTSGGICFPDCNSGSDCATGACDSEGSCEPPAAPDGGVPDGGVADGGVADGGVADGGVADASTAG